MKTTTRLLLSAFACASLGPLAVHAGTATFDFDSPIADLQIVSNLPAETPPVRDSDGNPGGYLAISDAVGSQSTKVLFPDFDDGLIVKAFSFSMDVRAGNGTTDRPADGFSISYARANDPFVNDPNLADSNLAAGLPEAGTTTGIAIGFDAWQGNVLPDGDDIEGIIVRVDNVTVLRQALPLRHGAVDDPTSMQTGPIDPADDRTGSVDNLGWARLEVELDELGRLTVSWKGTVILDQFETSFFPSPGRLVLAGRTGGSNQNQHIDNIEITTIPSEGALLTGFFPTPNGVTIEITDTPSSVADLSTVELILDGNPVPAGQITAEKFGSFGNRIVFSNLPESLFLSGSMHTMSISVSDMDGNPIEIADREWTTITYSSVPGFFAVEESFVDLTRGGFRVHPYKTAVANPNQIQFSEEVLLGVHGPNTADLTLGPDIDNDGVPDPATPDADGFFHETLVINYENVAVGAGNFQDPTFEDEILSEHPIPGFDPSTGTAGFSDNAVLEIVTYVHFPERAVYSMGVNSDDGFKVSVAPNYRDTFGQVLGFFNGGRGPTDSIFHFLIEEPGYYPMRLLWFNGGGGAAVEWFTVLGDGTKVLINDPNTEGALASHPFPGDTRTRITDNTLNSLLGATVRADFSINIELTDGSTTIDPGNVSLTLDGSSEGVEVNKTGGVTTVTRGSDQLLPPGASVEVVFSYETGGETVSYTVTPTIVNYVQVPPTLKTDVGTGNAGELGFRWRTYQVESGGGTSTVINEEVLAGVRGPNVADLTNAEADGFFHLTGVINFNQDAPAAIGSFSSTAAPPLNITDEPIPGIPGTTGSTDNIAAEVLTFVDFPAGLYQMGVNSDDGFRVTVATSELDLNPADPANLQLGVFDGGRGAADTLFFFSISEAGVYPLRLLWYEGGGGANVEWFTLNASGARFLLNEDREGAFVAYRSRTAVPDISTGPIFDAPVLAGDEFTLGWTGEGVLQQANAITGPWTDSPNQANPQTLSTTEADSLFFRVVAAGE